MSGFVYRLVVVKPEGSDEPGWEPEDWREGLALDLGYASEGSPSGGIDYCPDFVWPKRRLYLSRSAADARAVLLRKYGAVVTVECSEPIVFPSPVPASEPCETCNDTGVFIGGPRFGEPCSKCRPKAEPCETCLGHGMAMFPRGAGSVLGKCPSCLGSGVKPKEDK